MADLLEQTLAGALAAQLWFRLESSEQLSRFEDFGVHDVSRPLFLNPTALEDAARLLDSWVEAGRLRREWEIYCPRCKAQCVQQATAESAAQHWVGFLADCPHCELEFNCYQRYLHPVYLVSDAYYRIQQPLGRRRLRPSGLAELERLRCR